MTAAACNTPTMAALPAMLNLEAQPVPSLKDVGTSWWLATVGEVIARNMLLKVSNSILLSAETTSATLALSNM